MSLKIKFLQYDFNSVVSREITIESYDGNCGSCLHYVPVILLRKGLCDFPIVSVIQSSIINLVISKKEVKSCLVFFKIMTSTSVGQAKKAFLCLSLKAHNVQKFFL